MIQLKAELQIPHSVYFKHQHSMPHQHLFQLQIPASLTYFRGHFPGMPVLPAVAMIDITQLLVSEFILSQTQTFLEKLDSLKIKEAVLPDQVLQVLITTDPLLQSFEAQWLDLSQKKLAELFFSLQK